MPPPDEPKGPPKPPCVYDCRRVKAEAAKKPKFKSLPRHNKFKGLLSAIKGAILGKVTESCGKKITLPICVGPDTPECATRCDDKMNLKKARVKCEALEAACDQKPHIVSGKCEFYCQQSTGMIGYTGCGMMANIDLCATGTKPTDSCCGSCESKKCKKKIIPRCKALKDPEGNTPCTSKNARPVGERPCTVKMHMGFAPASFGTGIGFSYAPVMVCLKKVVKIFGG